MVVASVSCIYGLGGPAEYQNQLLVLRTGESYDHRAILRRLVDMHYERNDANLARGRFRVRGDTLEVRPAYAENVIRVGLFGDEWADHVLDPVTGERLDALTR